MTPPSGAPRPSGALEGIRVIDITTTVVGPCATQILGDLGADVIRIEPPEGDQLRNLGPARHEGMAAMFLGLNRNKRSIVLDLKRPESRPVLQRLLAGADVLVHNMRPSAAQRLGIGYRDLAADHPRLVHASASGYRPDGPMGEEPAFDEVIQGASGISALFERAGEPARYAPFIIADKVAGHILASAIGFALFERERSGLGQEVQVPMFEAMVEFNLLEHFWGRAFDPPLAAAGYTRIFTPERRPFRTRDGHVCVTATTDAQWARLFVAIGRPELARDPRFEKMAQRSFPRRARCRALSTVLGALLVMVYGTQGLTVDTPLPKGTFLVGPVRVSQLHLIAAVTSWVCMAGFGAFFRFTNTGLLMRATAAGHEAAVVSGVNVNRMNRLAWAIGSMLAAIGGLFLCQLQLASVELEHIGLLALPAVVIGGLQSIPGAIVGGLLVGLIEQLSSTYISPKSADMFIYGLLLLVLMVRPWGLFGQRELGRV